MTDEKKKGLKMKNVTKRNAPKPYVQTYNLVGFSVIYLFIYMIFFFNKKVKILINLIRVGCIILTQEFVLKLFKRYTWV